MSYNLSLSDDRFSIVATIVEQEIADRPVDVKAAVATYAQGNPWAARLLARQCKTFTTLAQVEEVVGWPMKGERKETGAQIYERLSGR